MTGPAAPVALPGDDAAWDTFVASVPAGFHLQQSGWARVKAANGWRADRVVVTTDAGAAGVQLLVRRPRGSPLGIGYAPRGPVIGAWDASSVEQLTAAIRARARALRCTHVTLDPGTTDPSVPELLRAAGWRPADPVQHTRTRIVDLRPGEEALWSDLRSKWRQYVGHARRAGVTITEGTAADLPAFHAILAETAERTGFFPRDRSAYAAVWSAFAPSGAARLLVARLADDTPVAALFLVRCGTRVAEPYGGMTGAGAESRANYLLKWESLRRAAADGAELYDMWGIAHPGIEQFKAGFGGTEVTYPGAFDLAIVPGASRALSAARRTWVRFVRRRLAAPGSPSSRPERPAEPAPAAPSGPPVPPAVGRSSSADGADGADRA